MSRKPTSTLLSILAVLLAIGMIVPLTPPAALAREIGPEEPDNAPPASPPAIFQPSIPEDELVQLLAGNPTDTLDPAVCYETGCGHIIHQVYDTLIGYNREKSDEFVPMLAAGWTISPDGRTYTFNIRDNVRFHNGALLTASDVAYSFQRGILQGDTNSPQWLFTEALFGTGIGNVCDLIDPSVCDDRSALINYQATHAAQVSQVCTDLTTKISANNAAGTVTFQLAQPWGPWLATLAGHYASILDRDWAIANGAWNGDCNAWHYYSATNRSNTTLGLMENGTGPFKLNHWTQNIEFVLDRNDSYWLQTPPWPGAMFGPAAFSKITMPIIENTDTHSMMLLNNQADLAFFSNSYVSTLDAATQLWYPATDTITPTLLSPAGTIKKYTGGLGISATDAFFNYNIATGGTRNYVGSGAWNGAGIPTNFFNDIHVRKGFNYAFNFSAYNSALFGGTGIQRSGPIIRGLIGYRDTQPKYSYNPPLALSELNQAWGGQIAAHGFTLTLGYATTNNSTKVFAETMKAGIEALDSRFHVNLLGITQTEYNSDFANNRLPIFVRGWYQDIPHPHNWVVPYTIGTYAYRQRLPDTLRATYDYLANYCLGVPAAQAPNCYETIQGQTYLDALDIFLFQGYQRAYTSNALHGYYFHPSGSVNLYQLYKSAPTSAVTANPSSEASLSFSNNANVDATLTVPAGSYAAPIQLVAIPDNPVYANTFNFLLDDTAFDIKAFSGAGVDLGHIDFNNPVSLMLSYPAGKYTPEAESNLSLTWWNGSTWVDAACGEYIRDLVNHTLTVPICHLSKFTLGQDSISLMLPLMLK